ncbi:MAG: hypothetical protein WCH43_06855 [Verrucomicrobiota bacterium]
MMSTVAVSSYHFTESVDQLGSGASTGGLARPTVSLEMDPVRPLSGQPTRNPRSVQQELRHFVVKRRLKGFVTDTQGETWRVIFQEGNQQIPYDLPSERLRKSGIKSRYQPFEMDELESTLEDISGKMYRFRPLAAAKDVFLETLPLDSERQRKYDLILARFGKSKA